MTDDAQVLVPSSPLPEDRYGIFSDVDPGTRTLPAGTQIAPPFRSLPVPAHTFDRVVKLAPGDVVEVEIELLPIGLAFHPGEQLRFVISSRNLLGPMMPRVREFVPVTGGQHVIHTGGYRASSIQLPVLADR